MVRYFPRTCTKYLCRYANFIPLGATGRVSTLQPLLPFYPSKSPGLSHAHSVSALSRLTSMFPRTESPMRGIIVQCYRLQCTNKKLERNRGEEGTMEKRERRGMLKREKRKIKKKKTKKRKNHRRRVVAYEVGRGNGV